MTVYFVLKVLPKTDFEPSRIHVNISMFTYAWSRKVTSEEALELLETILKSDYLNQTQEAVFCGTWNGQSYMEISNAIGYDYGYVKDTGAQLWRSLSDVLGEKVTKKNVRKILNKINRKTIQRDIAVATAPGEFRAKQSWEEKIDVEKFYGRLKERATLESWIFRDRSRLVSVLGIGGVGKTALSTKLATDAQEHFDYVIWRTLRHAPPLNELLSDIILVLSDQQDVSPPEHSEKRIGHFLKYLAQYRCLLILDNVESILQRSINAGYYRETYQEYASLFERIADECHQSCLMMTSRESPVGLLRRSGPHSSVKVLHLDGLDQAAIREVIHDKGLTILDHEHEQLYSHYCGNPLALKIVAATINAVFGGNVSEFLTYGTLVFGGLWDVLEQQFLRLPALEQKVMYWLAINRSWVKLPELREDLLLLVSPRELLEAVESLKARSLIETSVDGVTQQPVVMEYMTERLITQFYADLNQQKADFVCQYALLKAQSQDFIRDSQVRLISQPLLEKLVANIGFASKVGQQLQALLLIIKRKPIEEVGYAGGNLINLMCQLNIDLTGQDFSNLPIWQAYLPAQNLHQVNLANSDLSKSVFSETFGGLHSIAFSPDGKLLASSDSNGEIHLWQVSNGQRVRFWKANEGWTWVITFSPDGKKLASGSDDHHIKIWEVSTGKLLTTLKGHQQRTWGGLDWRSDGQRLASGCEDYTIRIWDVNTGKCLSILKDKVNLENGIRPVLFMADECGHETKLISGSINKNIIQIWDLESGQCLKTLAGHHLGIPSLALSADQKTLFSGSGDRTIKCWNLETGQCLKTLHGHTDVIWSMSLSPDGKHLASASHDHTVRIWDTTTGECLKTLQGFTSRVLSVAFSPFDSLLASGSDDQMLRLWDIRSGRCVKTLKGHSQGNWAVAFSPDGNRLASGGVEGIVRIWDSQTGQLLNSLERMFSQVHSISYHPNQPILAVSALEKIYIWNLESNQLMRVLEAHQSEIWEINFSPDGEYLASASLDKTAKVWDWQQGMCLHTLEGYDFFVCGVSFSPGGKTLATGSQDAIVKVWDYKTGTCLTTLSMDGGDIFQLSLSPDGQNMICGNTQGKIHLWDMQTYQCLRTFAAHKQSIRTIAYAPDGTCFASGSEDQTVKIWDADSLECRMSLQGHQNMILLVTFSPDGKTLATASYDETVRFWDVNSGECLQVLRAPRLYEAMNIQGVKGLTEAQKSSLRALGAT